MRIFSIYRLDMFMYGYTPSEEDDAEAERMNNDTAPISNKAYMVIGAVGAIMLGGVVLSLLLLLH